jgi:putative tricarboxylic transport membrane protein
MNGGRRIDGSDLTLGVLALTGSAGYLYETAQIPASLLEDAVGARGVPLAIGWVMAVLGAVLCVRGVVRGRVDAGAPPEGTTFFSTALRPHAQALGLLAILAMYVVLLPYAGYIASTVLLIVTVAWFSGATRSSYLLVIAIAGSVFLWLMFDPMLGISLPAGSWWDGR